MEHQRAAEIHAAERYLLGELSAIDRDEFEEHFFSCSECAEDVRAINIFADNARVIFAQESGRRRVAAPTGPQQNTGWFAWLRPAFAIPMAATVLLLGVTGYQSLVTIPELHRELALATAPQSLPSTALHPLTRGEDPVIQLRKEDRFFNVVLDVNPPQSSPQYRFELQSDSGSRPLSLLVAAPPPGEPLSLLLPALPPGRYSLIVSGQTGPEIDRYRFIIRQR